MNQDVEALLVTYLNDQSDVTDLVGDRIYADTDLPKGYTPKGSGPAILLAVRSGTVAYSNLVVTASMQFRCYGVTTVEARDVAIALHEAVHEKRSGDIKWMHVEQSGQLLRTPGALWPYVLSFYRVEVNTKE